MRYRSAVAAVILALVGAAGCSRPSAEPIGHPDEDGFATVIGRLEAEAQVKSVGDTAISVFPPVDQPDGGRVVTARRTRGPVTAVYTLHFRRLPDRWVCAEARCEEQQPGQRSANRLSGPAIELDQLLVWLGW
jgi:hypothetical protein